MVYGLKKRLKSFGTTLNFLRHEIEATIKIFYNSQKWEKIRIGSMLIFETVAYLVQIKILLLMS